MWVSTPTVVGYISIVVRTLTCRHYGIYNTLNTLGTQHSICHNIFVFVMQLWMSTLYFRCRGVQLSAIAPWTTATGRPSTSEDLVHTCTQYNVFRIHTLFAIHTVGRPFLLSMYYIAQLSLKCYLLNLHLSSGTSCP